MTLLSFVLGTLFGAIILSTVTTTSSLVAEISPYVRSGLEYVFRFFTYLGENL